MNGPCQKPPSFSYPLSVKKNIDVLSFQVYYEPVAHNDLTICVIISL